LPLTLDDLELSQLSFELRFAHSYLMWDRAGQTWQEAARLFPGVTVQTAEPGKILMREGPIDLTVEPFRVNVQLFDEETLKDFPMVAAKFTQAVASIFEVTEFTRVGLREIHWKTFPTKEEAAGELLKFGLLKIPEGKHFGVSGSPINPEISFRIEEAHKGFSIRLKAESVEYKLPLPYLWRNVAKPISEVRQMLSVDIDSFAQGTILPSQISFEDWITQTRHVIRRDANGFLGS
jgi:hypothetical protein